MANILWKAGVSGDWTLGGNWAGGAVPGVASSVVIAAPPAITGTAYTVSLNIAEQVNALTLSQALATLEVDNASLTLGSSLTLSAGTLLLRGSTLGGVSAQQTLTVSGAAGSAVAIGGLSNASQYDTLSNLGWRGTLDLVGAPPSNFYYGPESVTLSNVSFAGAGGSGAGQLAIGTGVTLNTAVLANVHATVGGGATLSADQAGTLTIAANASLSDSTTGSAIISATDFTNAGTLAISNGAIVDTMEPFNFSAAAFINTGTISVSGGGSLVVSSTNITNTGLIAVGAGGYVNIGSYSQGTLSNTGSFAVAAGGTLSINETLTTAQLAGFGVTAGTLGIANLLDNSGAVLTTGAGAAAANLLLDGGTITGGTIINTGGFAFDAGTAQSGVRAGTLSGVSFHGAIVLDNAELDTNSGFVLAGASAGKGATITLSGASTLVLADSQTLDHAVISLGATYSGSSIIVGSVLETAATHLVLGPHTTLTLTDLAGGLQTATATDTILNQGTITATLAGSSLTAGGLVNTGRITLSNGAMLNGIAVNAGTIAVGNGGEILGTNTFNSGPSGLLNTGIITEAQAGATLSFGGGLDNTGIVAVSNGATLALNVSFFSPNSGGLANTGTISVTDGVLVANNLTASQLESVQLTRSSVIATGQLTIDTGAPLRVGAGTALGSVKLTGGIAGGTVIDSGGGVVFYGAATLDNVTYQGALDVTRPLTTLTILDSFASTSGATGTAPGVINLTGAGSELLWRGTQALDNATLSIGNAALSYAGHTTGAPTFVAEGYYGTPVAFGGHLAIQHAATYASIGGAYDQNGFNTAAGTITSAATIHADLAHGQLSLEGAAFTNTGVIGISSGDTVTEGATAFTNAGAIAIGAGSTLALDTYNYFASATFAGFAFTSTGTIALYGGTLTDLTQGGAFPAVPILNTGTIGGAGLLDTRIDNAGAIVAGGGTLTLDQALTGAGRLIVGTGATLDLTAAVGAGQRVTFGGASGVLGLAPAAFHARLVSFVAGDAIDLTHTAANSAAFSGTAILVTLSGGGTFAIGTTSALSGSLATASDGHGGTLIDFAGAGSPAVAAALPTPAAPAWSPLHWQDPAGRASSCHFVHLHQA